MAAEAEQCPKPVEFEFMNKMLVAPRGQPDVMPLPIFTDGVQSVSCWELPPEHLEEVKKTGKIWIGIVSGVTQPPLWVSGTCPIQKQEPE